MRLKLDDLNKEWLYYLASPYSHEDPYIKELRYLKTLDCATKLTMYGFTLFEPIASSHHHAQRFGLPSGYDFWCKRDRKFIEKSDAVMVLTLSGWKDSVGVTDEIRFARDIGKPIFYIDPEFDQLSKLVLVDKECVYADRWIS